jgi:hypothetical protein
MPLFSIVIPTRNRAHLLSDALQSALAQTFDDYEIVICDNHSADATPAVAHAYEDRRVRYIRTDRTLSMPDNWEFALSKAGGEYITYLSDDDAVHPRLLATVHTLIREGRPEPWVWGHCFYFHSSLSAAEKRNSLTYTPCSGTARELESHTALKRLYSLRDMLHPYPKMLNCCCSRRVIEAASRERFFIHTAPDFSSAAAMLGAVRRYTFIDEPFWIAGASSESIGQSMVERLDSPAGNAFLAEFGDRSRFQHTPLQQPSEINVVADTLLRVQAAMPDRLARHSLGWARYFGECYIRIQRTRQSGGDVADHLDEFWRELRRQPIAVQARVRSEIAANGLLSRLSGRPVEVMRDPADLLKRAVRKGLSIGGVPRFRRGRPRVVSGSQGGFSNIAECAARLDIIMGRAPGADPTSRLSSARPDQQPASRP